MADLCHRNHHHPCRWYSCTQTLGTGVENNSRETGICPAPSSSLLADGASYSGMTAGEGGVLLSWLLLLS